MTITSDASLQGRKIGNWTRGPSMVPNSPFTSFVAYIIGGEGVDWGRDSIIKVVSANKGAVTMKRNILH